MQKGETGTVESLITDHRHGASRMSRIELINANPQSVSKLSRSKTPPLASTLHHDLVAFAARKIRGPSFARAHTTTTSRLKKRN